MVIVDEIQKAPSLLEEVHWLLENTDLHFVLCGSSARKLRREARNLLGGRAIGFSLFPLVSTEIPDIDLDRYLRHGGLPAHYLLENPELSLKSYVNNYLKEEIIDESLTRNIPAFHRFLQTVALSHGQQMNYANIARETGVSASTVRNYYQILKDTLLGYELEPWRRTARRRLVESSKFYLFDVGVLHALGPKLGEVQRGTDIYGRAFEHFLINEVRAYLSYCQLDYPLSYWRTSSGFEVDLIVGDMDLVLEFKATSALKSAHLKGLRRLKEEYKTGRAIVVSLDEVSKKSEDEIDMLHWRDFCKRLWRKELL